METNFVLICSHHDISANNHDSYPSIMDRFVESFSDPVGIYAFGKYIGDIVSVDKRGNDLY